MRRILIFAFLNRDPRTRTGWYDLVLVLQKFEKIWTDLPGSVQTGTVPVVPNILKNSRSLAVHGSWIPVFECCLGSFYTN